MTVKEFRIQYALGSLSTDNLKELAKNKRTAKKILTILSTNEDLFVVCGVAANPNTPARAIKNTYITSKLWSHKKGGLIRYGIATNLSTPVNLLKQLINMYSKDFWDTFHIEEAAKRTIKKIKKLKKI